MIYEEIINEAETKFGAGGNRFKWKEGTNRIRVLAATKPFESTFQGRKKVNYLHYIIDRADGRVKLAFFPYTIVKAIGSLEKNVDYTFTELPMPYDITVNAKNAGTIDVEYDVMPARQNSPITDSEKDEFSKMKPLDQIRESLKNKNQETKPVTQHEVITNEIKKIEPSTEEISVDDIPF